jgi:hypothetical protein
VRGGAAALDGAALWRVPADFRAGLLRARSLARCQRVEVAAAGARGARAAYLLDGAHTIESVESGARWAAEQGAQGRAGGARAWRVLVFYCSGDRDPPALMRPLAALHRAEPFDAVAVCSNAVQADPPPVLTGHVSSLPRTNWTCLVPQADSRGMAPRDWERALAAYWREAIAAVGGAAAGGAAAAGAAAGGAAAGGAAAGGARAEIHATVPALVEWVERQAAARAPAGAPRAAPFAVVDGGAGAGAVEVEVYVTGSLLLCGDVLAELLRRGGGARGGGGDAETSDSALGFA